MGKTGLAVVATAGLAAGAAAQDISFTPEDGPGVLSQAFEKVLPGGIHTTEYIGFGVDFTGFSAAAYAGPPAAWSFVDGDGILSLDEFVGGRIVVPATGKPGTTDLVWVETDMTVDADAVQLVCWDSTGKFLGSSIADDGVGPDGGFLAKFQASGIASFMLMENGESEHGEESFGLRRIYLNTPVPGPDVAVVMAPALGAVVRRRR